MTKDEVARDLARRICEAFKVSLGQAVSLRLCIDLDAKGCPVAVLDVELRAPDEEAA